jgi:uncharacterized protein (DUF433 family)
MPIEDYFNFLAPDDIRLKGTRVGIESVLYQYIHRDRRAEDIVQSFPSLSLEQVYATILYYLANQPQVDAYLTAWLEWGERMREEQARNPSPAILKLRQAKAELRAARRKARVG